MRKKKDGKETWVGHEEGARMGEARICCLLRPSFRLRSTLLLFVSPFSPPPAVVDATDITATIQIGKKTV